METTDDDPGAVDSGADPGADSGAAEPDATDPPVDPAARARGHRARAGGRIAEEAVARWLERSGWSILARNWRGTRGELDIVAASGTCLAFIEVKARRHLGFGSPAASLGPAQRNRLRVTALEFLRAHRESDAPGRSHAERRTARWNTIRFDVVAVVWADDRRPIIERFPGAF